MPNHPGRTPWRSWTTCIIRTPTSAAPRTPSFRP